MNATPSMQYLGQLSLQLFMGWQNKHKMLGCRTVTGKMYRVQQKISPKILCSFLNACLELHSLDFTDILATL